MSVECMNCIFAFLKNILNSNSGTERLIVKNENTADENKNSYETNDDITTLSDETYTTSYETSTTYETTTTYESTSTYETNETYQFFEANTNEETTKQFPMTWASDGTNSDEMTTSLLGIVNQDKTFLEFENANTEIYEKVVLKGVYG